MMGVGIAPTHRDGKEDQVNGMCAKQSRSLSMIGGGEQVQYGIDWRRDEWEKRSEQQRCECRWWVHTVVRPQGEAITSCSQMQAGRIEMRCCTGLYSVRAQKRTDDGRGKVRYSSPYRILAVVVAAVGRKRAHNTPTLLGWKRRWMCRAE